MKTDPATLRAARRHFLARGAMSLTPLAMSWAIGRDRLQAAPVKPELARQSFDLLPKQPRKTPRATAMISMFMQGGPSQVDLMDPKPELTRLDGQQFPGTIKYDNAAQASSRVLGSPWKFRQHGECGTPISELLPGLSGIVDDVLVVRSMHTGVNNHGQSIHAMNTGRTQRGRPALGSWLTFGLGAETDELPAYVAMTDPRGLPVEGVLNWSNGWLPSLFQGTVVRPREPRILNLQPPERLRGEVQVNFLDLLTRLNRRHISRRQGELELEARIAEQTAAAERFATLRAAAEKAATEQAAERMIAEETAATALTGGQDALAAVGLEVGRPVRPMLAAPGDSLDAALAALGTDVTVEHKLDGARIQVHRRGDEVRVWTRTLREITDGVPELVELVRGLPCDTAVLDGETRTVTFSMEQVAHTLAPGQSVTVQIVTSSAKFLNFYSWGAITVEGMSVSLPTRAADEVSTTVAA